MSRSLAISIITLFSFSLASFGAYSLYQSQQKNAAFLLRTLELNQELIAQQSSDLAAADIAVRYFFEDDSKQRFRPLLKIFDAGEIAQDKYNRAFNALFDQNSGQKTTRQQRSDDFLHLQKVADRSLHDVLQEIVNVFTTYGESMNLNTDDIEVINERFEEMIREANLLGYNAGQLSEDEYALRKGWLTLSFQNVLRRFLEGSNSFYCSRSYQYDAYYPIVMNANNHIAIGETESVKIGIGSYSTRLKPENVDLRVNGKRQMLSKTGLAEISLTGKKKGEHSLHLSVSVRDAFNGDTSYSESIYRYVVE